MIDYSNDLLYIKLIKEEVSGVINMISIADIAELAGVSVTTVSLALNNKKGVGKKTKERILQIAEENNYKPIRMSKAKKEAMKEEQHKEKLNLKFIVAINNEVVNTNFRTQPFFSSLVNTLVQDSNTDQFNIVIAAADSNDLTKELASYNQVDDVDGLIILATDLSNKVLTDLVDRTDKPLLFLDATNQLLDANFIGINNEQGIYLALSHLVAHGHQTIGYVMSENRINNFNERLLAFEKHSVNLGLNFNLKDSILSSPNTIEAQEEVKKQLADLDHMPEAFLCENDVIAISFIKTLTQMGYRVPEDISVIGFDNIREGSVITPELTTIEVNQGLIVETAVNQLISIIENKSSTQHIYINCKLVDRNSVKQK